MQSGSKHSITSANISASMPGFPKTSPGLKTRATEAPTQDMREKDTHAMNFPESVRATVAVKRGEYDARRLRSQREVIRDVMLAAANCDTWLTLGELRALTHYGEASISAQLRHLRKPDNGAYDVTKRRREDSLTGRLLSDAGGDFLWEYRVARSMSM
jgi:hypothetical protein